MAANLSPVHYILFCCDEIHMAYGCKVTILRADRNGIFMCQILLPFLKQSCSKQGFSDLVKIRRMGTPLHFLSKIIVFQFLSINGANVFLNMKALLSSLTPSKVQDRRDSATTRDQRHPYHRRPPLMTVHVFVLWLPPLGKRSGREERFSGRGRPWAEEAREGQEASRM